MKDLEPLFNKYRTAVLTYDQPILAYADPRCNHKVVNGWMSGPPGHRLYIRLADLISKIIEEKGISEILPYDEREGYSGDWLGTSRFYKFCSCVFIFRVSSWKTILVAFVHSRRLPVE